MHDGRFASLEEVLTFYNTLEGQIRRHHHAEDVLQPLELPEDQLRDLQAFLEALTGSPPPEHLRRSPAIAGTQRPIPPE